MKKSSNPNAKKSPGQNPAASAKRMREGNEKPRRKAVSAAPVWTQVISERLQSSSQRQCLYFLIFGILLFAVGLGIYRSSTTYITQDSSDEVIHITEELDKGQINDPDVKITGVPGKMEFGLMTAPGSQWSVTWTEKINPDAVPLVRIHSFSGGGVRNELVFRKGDAVTTVPLNASCSGTLIKPESMDSRSDTASVTFVSTALPGLSQPFPVLDRLAVGSRVYPKGELSATYYQVIWLLLTPLIAWFIGIAFISDRKKATVAACLLSLLCICLAGALPGVFQWVYYLMVAALFAVVCANYYSGHATTRPFIILDAVLGLSLASLLLAFRWPLLLQMLDLPLPADSIDYMGIAKEMSHPFATRHREPAFMWLLRIWFALTAWSPVCIRLLTLLLSVAEAFLTWKVARLFVSPVLALIVLVCYALNPALLGSSIQGLREELFPTCVMAFVYCSIRLMRQPSVKWTVLMAVAAGFLPLVRLSALPLVVFGCAMTLVLVRSTWKQYAITVGIIAAMILPMLIYQKVRNGEMMYPSNSYVATFYRNQEFQGQPGFPTPAEVSANPWAGTRIGMLEYMFSLHSPGEAIRHIFDGTCRLFVGKTIQDDLLRLTPSVSIDYNSWVHLAPVGKAKLAERILLGLFIIGLIGLFWKKETWIIAMAILAIQVPLAFLDSLKLINWRLTMNSIPLMLITAVIGLQILLHGVKKITGNR